MKKLISSLSQISSPSGDEEMLRCEISKLLKDLDQDIDPHGSLICHKKGIGDGIVILVPMDTPCLFITAPDKGFSRFALCDDFTLPDGAIVQFKNNAFGVVGKDDAGQFVDTGNIPMSIGERATLVPGCHALTDTRLSGFAAGTYAAIASVIKAALSETSKDVYFIFAAKTCIRQFSPAFMKDIHASLLCSVEVSHANDMPNEKTVFLSLGKGTALRVKDQNMLSSGKAIDIIEAIPHPTVREVSTRRGCGGAVQKAFGGIQSVGLGIPARYIGTAGETIDINDVINTANLLSSLLQ